MVYYVNRIRAMFRKDGTRILIKYSIIFLIASICFGSYIYFVEGKTLVDTIYYLFVTATTVGYGDVLPTTDAGKLMAIVYMIIAITVLGIILGITGEAFANKIEKTKKGEIDMGDKEVELMIVGYPSEDKVKEIVLQLRKDPEFDIKRIVCVTSELEEKPVWFNEHNVIFKKGLGSVREVLVEGGILNTKTALVLAQNANDIKSDDYTSSTVSAIEKLNPSVRTIVEKVRKDNLLFEASNADTITRVLNPKVLAQEVIHKGAIQLQNTLFDSDTNTSQTNSQILKETTWGELAIEMIRENKSLLGFMNPEEELFNFQPDFNDTIHKGATIKFRITKA